MILYNIVSCDIWYNIILYDILTQCDKVSYDMILYRIQIVLYCVIWYDIFFSYRAKYDKYHILEYRITLYVNLSSSYNILSYYMLQYCKIYYDIVHVIYQIESQSMTWYCIIRYCISWYFALYDIVSYIIVSCDMLSYLILQYHIIWYYTVCQMIWYCIIKYVYILRK